MDCPYNKQRYYDQPSILWVVVGGVVVVVVVGVANLPLHVLACPYGSLKAQGYFD